MANEGKYLFRRVYSVFLQSPTASSGIAYGNHYSNQTALRVAFSIEKKTESAPNKGTITLFNLNPKTRAAISLGWTIRLRCGYENLVDTIFIGKIGIVNHTRQGPDIASSLQVSEGFRALLETPFQKSYPPKTHVAQVLQDIAKQMDVKIGVVRDIPDVVYAKGLTLSHGCRDALDTVLKPLKMEAAISNERLNILPADKPFGTRAVVVSKDSGLINTPTIEKRDVNFDAVLLPQLTVPGQLVQVKTGDAAASGFFKIRSVKVEGDSHGEAWSVSCNCARITGFTVKPLTAYGYDFNSAIKGLV